MMRINLKGVEMYPDRVCPECGKTFTPTKKNQVYDTAYCRTKASRQRRKGELAPFDRAGMLDEIRKYDAETARDIEMLAMKAGKQMAEDVLVVAWRAMHRAALRLALTDTQGLIEQAAVKVKKQRGRPPKK